MTVLTSDWEVTTFSKGNPYDQRNKAVCLGFKKDNEAATTIFGSYTSAVPDLREYSLCVFFNAKFDVSWYRKLGFVLPGIRIWCCQIAEFVLGGQKQRYPSLEETAIKYGLGHKIDIIKLEYWDKGINTDAIPQDILSEYCNQDVELTYKIYLKQLEQFQDNPRLYLLFKLMCQDLLTLQEMEWNGQLYDEQLCEERSKSIELDIKSLVSNLESMYPHIPINFNSPAQLSCWLYGGRIPYSERELVGTYKNGKPKFKLVDKYYELPRLVDPLDGTETATPGIYKTDEATLRKLKGPMAKKYVGTLLKLAELDKLNSTYYKGLPAKNKECNWPQGMIHGQFNQVVAQTGRLSSANPNLQNFSGDCLDVFISRYDT